MANVTFLTFYLQFWVYISQFWVYISQFWVYISQFWVYISQFWVYISQFWVYISQFWVYISQFWVYISQFWVYISQFWVYISQFCFLFPPQNKIFKKVTATVSFIWWLCDLSHNSNFFSQNRGEKKSELWDKKLQLDFFLSAPIMYFWKWSFMQCVTQL